MKLSTNLLTAILIFVLQTGLSQDLEFKHLIVRLNHKLLDFNKIDDSNLSKAHLSTFLNQEGTKFIENNGNQLIHFNNLVVEKIFDNYKTFDSISISRQGDTVYIPPFWATFRAYLPEDMKFNVFYRELKNAYPLVIFVDLPYVSIELHNLPNDSLYVSQSSLNSNDYPNSGIDIENAWAIETGKRFIKVGVFDSGIDSSHVDLDVIYGHRYGVTLNSWTTGIIDSTWGNDYNGHGTSVAGIIAAKRNNNFGIAGIAGGNYENDENGVSLFDFDIAFNPSAFFTADNIARALIDASRSPGNYHDWGQENVIENDQYYRNALGYGIHIANHSYNIKVLEPELPGKDILPGDTLSMPEPPPSVCHLCVESYLFALKNGVANVVARGNGSGSIPNILNTKAFPQRLHDSWIISVGASGLDGKRLNGPQNTMIGENWWSPIKMNLDVLAPGTTGLVVSTASSQSNGISNNNSYKRFSGTSASAPHVTGVAALLMSKYNKPCYSNRNLDPADIEYILQKSATDLNEIGYDDTTGWGRLNAYKALQMIEFPKYQIIHPTDDPISVETLEQDTIVLFLNDPFYQDFEGPLGSSFPLFINRKYKVVRYKLKNTYDISNYLSPPLVSPSVELLDTWVRHSQTTSLGFTADTTNFWNGNPAQAPEIIIDTLRIEPMAEINNLNNNTISIEGYYYHFINRLDNDFIPDLQVNYWYPINPFIQNPKMAFSLYLKDSLATSIIDFPCDSSNVLLDPAAETSILESNTYTFSLYPNPGNEKLFVTSLNLNVSGSLILQDNMGRICMEKQFVPHTLNTLETTALSKGAYIIQLRLDNNIVLSKKWIKL